MPQAEEFFGRPGIVMMSPQMTTTKPATRTEADFTNVERVAVGKAYGRGVG